MEAIAKLRRVSVSARKAALLADLIRGRSMASSLVILKNKSGRLAESFRKLLLSVVANWENLNATSFDQARLVVKRLAVDRAGMLKRTMPASKGMAHRIRRRFSHVTIVVDSEKKEPLVVSDGLGANFMGDKKDFIDKKGNGSKS